MTRFCPPSRDLQCVPVSVALRCNDALCLVNFVPCRPSLSTRASLVQMDSRGPSSQNVSLSRKVLRFVWLFPCTSLRLSSSIAHSLRHILICPPPRQARTSNGAKALEATFVAYRHSHSEAAFLHIRMLPSHVTRSYVIQHNRSRDLQCVPGCVAPRCNRVRRMSNLVPSPSSPSRGGRRMESREAPRCAALGCLQKFEEWLFLLS